MSRHLLSIADLGAEGIDEILQLTDTFVEVSARPIARVPALRGKTVAFCFYEDSTRTRVSFETAAKRLSADTVNFSIAASSVNKGASRRSAPWGSTGWSSATARRACPGRSPAGSTPR